MDNPESSVLTRYAAGAQAREAALCCPVSFDARYLEVLPQEIIDRDYGCGDPTRYVREGETVLDLGSGAGKVCWIAAQIVGPNGRVIGVDMNTTMLGLARQHHAAIAERVGYDNVEYRRAMIQDLRLDLDALEAGLVQKPVDGADAWLALRLEEDRLRREQPMVADDSVDVVLSNCVLNLVRPEDKTQLFDEIFRVTKPGGRVAISDIVADEDIPLAMQQDPDLWSGCISGAYREDHFLQAFVDAGFHGVQIAQRDEQPWQTVEGIEFRALTVQAYKAAPARELDRHQAVIYRGPFAEVRDEAGRVYRRGERMAVSERTFELLRQEPFAALFESIEPREAVASDQAKAFAECTGATRSPATTKGANYSATTTASDCCGPNPSDAPTSADDGTSGGGCC